MVRPIRRLLLKKGGAMEQEFDFEQLAHALIEATDIMESAQAEFFLMGKTAEQMYHNKPLSGNKIELGIKKQELADTTIDLLKIAEPSIDIQDRKIIMECNGVPVEIKIIKLHYRVLDKLDPIDYDHGDYIFDTYYVPNPFEAFTRMAKFMH